MTVHLKTLSVSDTNVGSSMMRRVSFRVPLAFLALTVACQTCDGEQTGSLINPAKTFGNRIAEVHSEMTETRYSHSTKIDLEKGVLICDCSGFFDFILREEFPEHYLSLRGKEQPTRVRPLAVTYHETFTSVEDQGSANGALSANGASANGASANGAWASIPSLMDARPGDIIAWRKKEIRKGSTTGHVCMVASHPEPIGEGLVKVQLIDSTTDPHENDTRPVGTNGVGSGHRTFVVDTSGQPIGKLNGSKRNASNIAIGRMIPLKQKTSVADDLQYLDLPKAEAVKLAEAKGMRWHIIREDGDPQLNNWTIDEERLSFVVVDGKIHHVFRG